MSRFSSAILVFICLTGLTTACAKKPVVEANSTSAPATPPKAASTEVAEISQKPVAAADRIFFEFDSYLLTDEARATLASNAALFRAEPGRKVLIEGHCDERGSDEYNMALGEKRARAVRAYLVSLGVSSSSLSVVSYGEEQPLDPTSTERAWARNRRAEFR